MDQNWKDKTCEKCVYLCDLDRSEHGNEGLCKRFPPPTVLIKGGNGATDDNRWTSVYPRCHVACDACAEYRTEQEPEYDIKAIRECLTETVEHLTALRIKCRENHGAKAKRILVKVIHHPKIDGAGSTYKQTREAFDEYVYEDIKAERRKGNEKCQRCGREIKIRGFCKTCRPPNKKEKHHV